MLPEDCSGSRQSVRVGCAGWSIPKHVASKFTIESQTAPYLARFLNLANKDSAHPN